MTPEQRTQLEGFLDRHGRPALCVLMYMGLEGTDEANDEGLVRTFDKHFSGAEYAESNIEQEDEVDHATNCVNLAKELRDGRACSEARQDIIRTTLELGFVELATLAAEMDRWIRAHQKAS